tara:strand:- start:3485 stop:4168 length:684 start_codon:yes stop_codon:yes gene_type:complete
MSKLILGDGLLGSELVRQTGWDYISRKKDGIDFTDYDTYKKLLKPYDEIINCIAHTDTYDKSKEKHWNINYRAVSDLVDICNHWNQKLIHISTDYVYSNSKSDASEDDVPVHCRNWYGYTKLLSDGYIQLKSNNYLLIRTSFKKEPFEYPEGWMIKGNFDYTSKISQLIIKLIDSNFDGIYNVGTKTKTLYELGKKTNPNIKPTYDYIDETVPEDISMNLKKLKSVL